MGESVNWRPISEYDEMKNKPKWVAFLVAEYGNGRNYLPKMVTLERHFGFRTTTHFFVLPDVADLKGNDQ